MNNDGIGWSWGIGFIRMGVSPNGKHWFSIGIPGTSFRYFRYLKNNKIQNDDYHSREVIDVGGQPEQPPKVITKWKNIK
jgi:hypothetical protein